MTTTKHSARDVPPHNLMHAQIYCTKLRDKLSQIALAAQWRLVNSSLQLLCTLSDSVVVRQKHFNIDTS